MLYRYSGEQDIIIGSPIAGRDHSDLEDQIGFYVNTLALRNQVDGNEYFDDFFARVRDTTLDAYEHQRYPFDRLVEELNLRRDTGRSALFDIMIVLQNIRDQGETIEINQENIGIIQDHGASKSKFDLTFSFKEQRDCIAMEIDYNSDVYNRDMVEQLMVNYQTLTELLLSDPKSPIGSIDYLTEKERKKLLETFNDTRTEYPRNKTIHQLFQEQVERTPDNVALVFEGKELTYSELNKKSNQLAHHIRNTYKQKTQNQLPPDTLIPLCLDRSMEMVIAIIAVLKAGGAYVPIDPSYPKERIDYLLNDAKAEIVLTQRHLNQHKDITLPKDKTIYIDLYEKIYQIEDNENLTSISKATDLAYVIYTSGTTGKPKGVMIEHGGSVNIFICKVFI